MCVTSMIMDHYREKWTHSGQVPKTTTTSSFVFPPVPAAITAEEVAEFRRLLDRARDYDKRMGEPECEMDEKRQAILSIAKQMGVEINFL